MFLRLFKWRSERLPGKSFRNVITDYFFAPLEKFMKCWYITTIINKKDGLMFAKRIIPCLDVTGGRVVKGVNFVHLVDAGDPVEAAKEYNRQGADELVFLDITATTAAAPWSTSSGALPRKYLSR